MKRTIETHYYSFRQSNTGGTFRLSSTQGHLTVIEAISRSDALRRAEELGLDLHDHNGDGEGERWDDPDDTTKTLPSGDPDVEKLLAELAYIADAVVAIHHLDGQSELHQRIPGHVPASEEESEAELKRRISAGHRFVVSTPEGWMTHKCDTRSHRRADLITRDQEDGRVFYLSASALKNLGLTQE